ncbi:MAG: beta-ketoacyl-[acyl-carrier-protein] synthase family protein [Archangiaceae bacterium]|nr:beta-ketoacyl-[acyl-carrier-protein] synthase family protein [Archangiaceae bacterium]
MRRAVITGIGAVSSLGLSLDTISSSLRSGASGIEFDPERKARGFRSALTGVIRGFDPAKHFDRKHRKTMSQAALFGCTSALDAVADAGFKRDALARPDVGVIFGNDSTCDAAEDLFGSLRETGRTSALGTGHIIRVMNSTVTMNLSNLLGVKGAAWTVSAACASGLHSLGQAAMMIAQGMQEVVICGGAQEIGWQGMAAFDALGALSTRESEPKTASRPFDQSRDGLVPSGGGAAMIVESIEHARARGAKIYAEILGYGFSCDGGHLTNPDGDGARRAMEAALKAAHVHPHELDYVHAHATSTPIGDAVEAQAISQVLAGHRAPVSSTKGLTGHECWMAGASELVYCLLMMRDGFVAGNPTLGTPDEKSAGLNLPKASLATRPRTVLKNSFGFGGTNGSVVLRSVD